MSADPDQYTAYGAEDYAFAGTALSDRLREDDLIAESRAAITSSWWLERVRTPISLERANVRLVRYAATASYSFVRFAASGGPRCIVAHELAHVLHRRLGRFGQQGHGPEWRGVYVGLTEALHGSHYADLLSDAFDSFGIPASEDARISVGAVPSLPIINIDHLSNMTAPTGGWRRP
jgi:hypothetical protein